MPPVLHGTSLTCTSRSHVRNYLICSIMFFSGKILNTRDRMMLILSIFPKKEKNQVISSDWTNWGSIASSLCIQRLNKMRTEKKYKNKNDILITKFCYKSRITENESNCVTVRIRRMIFTEDKENERLCRIPIFTHCPILARSHWTSSKHILTLVKIWGK